MRTTFDVAREIRAPAPRAWDLLVDTERWSEWGPSIVEVRASSSILSADCSGRIRTTLGVWLPFRVTDFVDGHRWSWRVAGVRATGHRVETSTKESCRVVFEVPLMWAGYGVVCDVALRRIERILVR